MQFNVLFNQTTQQMIVDFDQDAHFDVVFEETTQEISCLFGTVQVITEIRDAEFYKGDYTVTPDADGRTLPTASKTMSTDVTVKAIPYYDVSNPSGGTTIYIGTMDE